MRFTQINEGVKYGELQSLVRPYISVAEFEPKVGNESDVVVIGFYTTDEYPAKDLSRFLERGVTDLLDTEVSPAADDEGYYMVFVEVENENLMQKVFSILADVSHLVDISEWKIGFYEGREITITSDDIDAWLKKNS
jgi:hypothetical protein